MLFRKISLCLSLAAFAFLGLSACGGDSSSNGDAREKVAIVSSFDKLPDCTEDYEGDTVFVKDIKSDYICVEGEWTNADSLRIITGSSSSATSGNKTGDDASSSSVTPTDRTIKGVTQKGPFVKGSKVTVLELKSGRSLEQSGSTFIATIQENDGKFTLNARSMVSQFIELQAEGFYRNEVTGKKSSASLTLYALTDVMMRKGGAVNINLLTHLEYYRVRHLVIKENMKMDEAKEKAKNEILAAFGITGDFASSEDLDIFSTGDGNAALLAISILMQHNLDVADLTELLTAFASDIEEDGKWDDAEAARYKAEIADWANEQDISGGLALIRTNIEKWNLGKVPEFEKYVRNFRSANYGLGECSKNKYGNVLAIKNELSANYGSKIRFVCKDGEWVEASDIEKDTYQWAAGKDGNVKYGSVNKEACYVYEDGSWIPADAKSCLLELQGCTEQRQGHVERLSETVYYTCDNKSWREATDLEKDTYQWQAGTDGEIKKGTFTAKNYKYDELQGLWITANEYDVSLRLLGCTKKRLGAIEKSPVDNDYYACKNMKWSKATEEDYDTQGNLCSDDNIGAVILGKELTNKYYCTSKGWTLVPSGWSWKVPKEAHFNLGISYGNLTDNRNNNNKTYKTVTIGKGADAQTWMAENLNYYDETFKDLSWCYSEDPNCEITGRYYTWDAAKEACPNGWHLPTMEEWNKLIRYASDLVCKVDEMCADAATPLKSQNGWGKPYTFEGNPNGTDEYGFSAIPAGFRDKDGEFIFEGHEEGDEGGYVYASFWSASGNDTDPNKAWTVYLLHDGAVYITGEKKDFGFPVRCVKD